jgi:hypothetical protein
MAKRHTLDDSQGSRRGFRGLLGIGSFVLFGLSALALGAVIALLATHTPARQLSAGDSSRTSASNSSSSNGDWIPLRSLSSHDIIAAARRSELFNERSNLMGDHVTNFTHLGAPVLVVALQPPGARAGAYPDFFVLPILDNKGRVTDAAELELNAQHTAIHVIAIVSYTDPRAQGVTPRMSSANAQSAVRAQRHVTLQADTAPTLVYFPGDPVMQETGQVVWTAGGEFPADPIWLVHGADGKDYVVGNDGKVYDISELPMISR